MMIGGVIKEPPGLIVSDLLVGNTKNELEVHDGLLLRLMLLFLSSSSSIHPIV